MMVSKRMKVCIVAGAVLGLFCIVGAQARSGFEREAYWLFALWFNRLLMGVVIGMGTPLPVLSQAIGRGAILGFLVSFAFYSSTAYIDTVGFLAGVVYGVIIEYIAFKYGAAGN